MIVSTTEMIILDIFSYTGRCSNSLKCVLPKAIKLQKSWRIHTTIAKGRWGFQYPITCFRFFLNCAWKIKQWYNMCVCVLLVFQSQYLLSLWLNMLLKPYLFKISWVCFQKLYLTTITLQYLASIFHLVKRNTTIISILK